MDSNHSAQLIPYYPYLLTKKKITANRLHLLQEGELLLQVMSYPSYQDHHLLAHG